MDTGLAPSKTPQSNLSTPSASGWLAKLELGFAYKNTKTVVRHRHHQGPLLIQKPFYPEGPVCHAILLHPPAGVVAGDHLHLQIQVDSKAHALITTPGANKLYRSEGDTAHIEQHFHIADDGILEWLPQETIAFSDCQVQSNTHIHLQKGSKFLGWEITCLGRPAGEQFFSQGLYRQNLNVMCADKPLVLERNRFQAGPLLQQAWGLNGHYCSGSLFAYPATAELLQTAREIPCPQHCQTGITLLEDTLVCRILSPQAETARRYFTALWQSLRPQLLQRTATIPRIWAT